MTADVAAPAGAVAQVAGTPVRAGFVPWPYPTAAGLTLGVAAALAAGPAAPHAVTTIGCCVAAGGLLGVLRARWCGARARAPHLGGALRRVLPLLLLSGGCGMVRMAAHDASLVARQARVAPWLEREVEWRGSFDGTTFAAVEPAAVRLALVARSAVPEGVLRLRATAVAAPGKRNPGGFDYAGYLERRGIVGQLFVEEVLWASERTSLRARLRAGVAAGLPADLAALMAAMTLGIRDDLGELRDAFTASGLAHVLSLSGLHVGVLLAAAGRLLVRTGRARPYLLMVVTVGFVLLVGSAPSVLRAAAMAFAVLCSLAAGFGKLESWTVLALAYVLGLAATPQMLLDVSFQLSYLALAGLLAFARPLGVRFGVAKVARGAPPLRGGAVLGLRNAALGGTAVSVAAQLPTLSLVAGSFGSVPLAAVVVNLVAVPVACVAVPLGFAAGLLGLVVPPLAWLLNRVTLVLAHALVWCAEVGSRAPALAWGEVSWLGHLCWAAFAMAAALWVRRWLALRRFLLVALCAGAATALAGPAARPPDIWFLDVGQGDSVLIRLPGRYEVLIDGGGSPFSDDDVGARVVLPALRALGVDELELVVATHPDADHIEGLFTVLASMPVGTLVTGPAWPDVELDSRLRRLASERGVPVHVAQRGEVLVLGAGGVDATLEVLHPPPAAGGASSNESSVVTVLRYRGQAVALFTGDAGGPTEERIAVPHVDLLQAGHHGSRFSTTDHLLLAASPRVAVVSVGANNYGHPHADVLARLAEHRVDTYLTRSSGAVRFAIGAGGAVTTATGRGGTAVSAK